MTPHTLCHIVYGVTKRQEAERQGDNWEVQVRRGFLELAILAALWNGKLYGLEILRRLEDDSELIVSEGTIYPLLSRLKNTGLVSSEWVESDGGHPRKYYALTAAGKQRTMEMASVWGRFSAAMAKVLRPIPKEK